MPARANRRRWAALPGALGRAYHVQRLAFVRGSVALTVPALALSAFGQSVAQKPDLRVGDEWIFHEVGTVDSQPIDRLAASDRRVAA
jgi:hypothetical protein